MLPFCALSIFNRFFVMVLTAYMYVAYIQGFDHSMQFAKEKEMQLRFGFPIKKNSYFQTLPYFIFTYFLRLIEKPRESKNRKLK